LDKQANCLRFYRGGWCPCCNAAIYGFMDIEQQIVDLGYQIVAISPDD
jgi:peroxiredoxin